MPADTTLLLLGTGLTMVDVVLSLADRGLGFVRPVGAAQDSGAFEYDADRILTNGYD